MIAGVSPTWSDTVRSAKFLVKAPLILAMLFVINLMTSPGHWWVQWPALGLGIAWVISLMRVARAVVLAGGAGGGGRDPDAPALRPVPARADYGTTIGSAAP